MKAELLDIVERLEGFRNWISSSDDIRKEDLLSEIDVIRVKLAEIAAADSET